MLPSNYMSSVKNVQAIMQKIIEGTAPERFTTNHLKSLGFASSNDRAIIPMLKALGFLSESGEPTQRYHQYRNKSQAGRVMAEALREAYPEIFHINEKPSRADRPAIQGRFKSDLNVSDRVAELMAMTFLAFLELADLDAPAPRAKQDTSKKDSTPVVHHDATISQSHQSPASLPTQSSVNLRYNIEVHLPATKDVEVYNAIFKSLKEHLVD